MSGSSLPPEPRLGITNACMHRSAASARELVDGVDGLGRLGERQRVVGVGRGRHAPTAPSSSSPSRGRAPSGSGSARGSRSGRSRRRRRPSEPSAGSRTGRRDRRGLRPDGGEERVDRRVATRHIPSGSTWCDCTSKMNSPGRLRSVSRPLRPAHSRSQASASCRCCRPSRSCRSGPRDHVDRPEADRRRRRRAHELARGSCRTCAASARSRGSASSHDRQLPRARRRREVLLVGARHDVDRQVLGELLPANRAGLELGDGPVALPVDHSVTSNAPRMNGWMRQK